MPWVAGRSCCNAAPAIFLPLSTPEHEAGHWLQAHILLLRLLPLVLLQRRVAGCRVRRLLASFIWRLRPRLVPLQWWLLVQCKWAHRCASPLRRAAVAVCLLGPLLVLIIEAQDVWPVQGHDVLTPYGVSGSVGAAQQLREGSNGRRAPARGAVPFALACIPSAVVHKGGAAAEARGGCARPRRQPGRAQLASCVHCMHIMLESMVQVLYAYIFQTHNMYERKVCFWAESRHNILSLYSGQHQQRAHLLR